MKLIKIVLELGLGLLVVASNPNIVKAAESKVTVGAGTAYNTSTNSNTSYLWGRLVKDKYKFTGYYKAPVNNVSYYGGDIIVDVVNTGKGSIAAGAGLQLGDGRIVPYAVLSGSTYINELINIEGSVKVPTDSKYGTDLSLQLGYRL